MKLQCEHYGSICLLRPLDEEARAWLQETAPEDAQFMGDALAVEPRYVPGVFVAFKAAGGEVV